MEAEADCKSEAGRRFGEGQPGGREKKGFR
jgi:hypothetical protein